MAVRRKRRSTTKRRRNPIRTTGALVVNPKRRRARRKAKAAAPKRRHRKASAAPKRRRRSRRRARAVVAPAAPKRRRHRRKAAAAAPKRRRSRRRARRNPAHVTGYTLVRNPLRINRRRRRNPLRINRRRRNPLLTRSNPRRRHHRRNPLYRTNGGGVLSGVLSPIQGLLGKLPVVGPMLSSAVGFVGPAVLGALGVEPTLWFARLVGPFVPQIPTSIFYPLAASLLAAAVYRFAPVSPDMKKSLAIAIASGGGAVGYYKFRTGSDAEVVAEAGMLEMSGVGAFGDGMLQRVVPYSGAVVGR